MSRTFFLGAGITGLSAGAITKKPVFEALESPGGICSSYYMRRGRDDYQRERIDPETYRFELGGGHWIFGGDPVILRFLRSIASCKTHVRKSSVFFPRENLFVPYPIQNHLSHLGSAIAKRVLDELNNPISDVPETMAHWLRSTFGPTLCELFFDPFHELYTAGLWRTIAPQDEFKTPVDLNLVKQGANSSVAPTGYNATFLYPENGLDQMCLELARRADVHFGKKAIRIDCDSREIHFEHGESIPFDDLVSTLPLNRLMDMAGIKTAARPDPSTSVLVVNVGGKKGPACPSDHWVYTAHSDGLFHRVGFYSNVDVSFLPASVRSSNDRVSIYIEKAYAGARPDPREIERVSALMIKKLQEWKWLGDVEVVHPTWIDVAYTWSWPRSPWKSQALAAAESKKIYSIGRYGRWKFQGIADSLRDGFLAGAAFADK